MRLRFCVQNANGKFSVNKITSATIITSESNLVDSMFISRNISSIFLLIKQACIGNNFNAFGSQDYDWSAHKTPFISWPPACRKVRTWCWNISVVVNNHVTSKQVHDLTINATVLKLSHSFEEYFDHFYISDYCLCTNRSISKHNCKIVCAGCVRDGRHISLVKCHIGVSFTFFCRKSLIVSTWLTFPRLANYYIRYLQINQHLLDLIWQRNVWLCGFCMWRWHESKHHIGDLNCMYLIERLGHVGSFEWFNPLHIVLPQLSWAFWFVHRLLSWQYIINTCTQTRTWQLTQVCGPASRQCSCIFFIRF